MNDNSIFQGKVRTLRSLAGLPNIPARLSESVLLIVDAQKEYQDGVLRLVGFEAAVKEIRVLLDRARALGAPVIHVVHKGKPGSKAFDPGSNRVEIIDTLTPAAGEIVVEKSLPNSFAQTALESELDKIGRKDLVIVGFMTHMCVSSTTRAAAEKGFRCTVVEHACATRDLPDGKGGVIDAGAIQAANLAALADRFAIVVANENQVP